jgi:hypothetical protein
MSARCFARMKCDDQSLSPVIYDLGSAFETQLGRDLIQ